eukprot:1202703-Alexandrium_andersonii.AAC.1
MDRLANSPSLPSAVHALADGGPLGSARRFPLRSEGNQGRLRARPMCTSNYSGARVHALPHSALLTHAMSSSWPSTP